MKLKTLQIDGDLLILNDAFKNEIFEIIDSNTELSDWNKSIFYALVDEVLNEE